MTEHRSGAAGQHRREPPPLGVRLRIADRVDTHVHGMQATVAQSVGDGGTAHAAGEQLPAPDDPVLDRGKRRDDRIR